MAFKLAEAFVKVVVDSKSVDAGLKSIQGQADKTKAALDGIASHAKIAFAALTGGIGVIAKLSSDAEESESKFEAVFKNQAEVARQWSVELGRSINRSSITIRRFASDLQNTFVPLGFSRDRAFELSKQIAALAFDLASFNNVAEDETLTLLTSAIVGNHEAVRRFGISITEATLKQELLRMGFKGNVAQVDELTKVQARLNIIMGATADAQGDAARTSGSFANTMRGLIDQAKELAIVFGDQVKPALRNIMAGLNDLVITVKESDEATLKMGARWLEVGVALSGLLVIVPKLVGAVGALSSGVAALVGATTALGTVLTGGLILALSGFAAVLATAILNGETLGDTVLRLTDGLFGLRTELQELDRFAGGDARINAIIRSAETAMGTDAAPEKIREAIKQLEIENKLKQDEQARVLKEGSVTNSVTGAITVSDEAQQRIKEIGRERSLIDSNIKRLQGDLKWEEQLTAQRAKEREAEAAKEAKAKAAAATEAKFGERFKAMGGLTMGEMSSLPGMGFLRDVPARQAARGLWLQRAEQEREEERQRELKSGGKSASAARVDASGGPQFARNIGVNSPVLEQLARQTQSGAGRNDDRLAASSTRQAELLEKLEKDGFAIRNVGEMKAMFDTLVGWG